MTHNIVSFIREGRLDRDQPPGITKYGFRNAYTKRCGFPDLRPKTFGIAQRGNVVRA